LSKFWESLGEKLADRWLLVDGATSVDRVLEAAKLLEDSASRELARELEYRARLEGRSGTIVTTTGGLVTAVGAIIAFSPRAANFRLPTAALVAVAISLIFFLASIVAVQVSNFPRREIKLSEEALVSRAEIEALTRWFKTRRDDLSIDAVASRLMDNQTHAFELRETNRLTAFWIRVALIAQMFAVTGLTLAALALLLAGTGVANS
jgi:hypothetical protein